MQDTPCKERPLIGTPRTDPTRSDSAVNNVLMPSPRNSLLKAERICASRSGSGASQSKPCSPSMKRRRMARRRTALISRSQRPPSGHRRLHLAFLWSEIRGSDGAAGEGQSVHPPDRAITGPIRAGVHEGLHDYQSGILWSAYPIKLWAFGPPSVSSSDAEKARRNPPTRGA